jgi:hypothetical protein
MQSILFNKTLFLMDARVKPGHDQFRSSGPAQKNASVRISMLSRGRALGGEVGSSNAV